MRLWQYLVSLVAMWMAPLALGMVSGPSEPVRVVIPHWQRRRRSQNAHTATQAAVMF